MTLQQKALVRYWLTGMLAVIVLFLFSGRENIRLFFLLSLPVVFVIDKTMKPPRPEGAPTPIEIIERSTALKYFLAVYMLGAAVLAVISISVSSVGSWLSGNPWLVFPLVGAPIAGLILLSEIALYKAYGETEP
mgnify:CR=1